jgi:hypothetical protein
MGVVVGDLVGKELGIDKELNNLLSDDVEFETKYDRCKHQAEDPKKAGLTDSHHECATTRTSQQKSDPPLIVDHHHGGYYTDVAVGAVRCASAMRSLYKYIALKFAIPDEPKDSGFCMLNLLHAKLWQDDPL